MATIDASTNVLAHCNQCRGGTPHAELETCKATDRTFDEPSRTEVHFVNTYTLLQCRVCGHARLRLLRWNSENDEGPPQFFPPPTNRQPPDWLHELEDPLRALLAEVYAALDAGMYAIALMGVRSVLDVWVSDRTTDRNDFPRKLKELVTDGALSAQQVEILESTFDAGSAAAHRGFRPKPHDAIAATEAVENLLHQYVLLPRIAKLKTNTPPRSRK